MDDVCGARAQYCACDLPLHDQGVTHQCGCGSEWLGDYMADSFRIVHLPPDNLAVGRWADAKLSRVAGMPSHPSVMASLTADAVAKLHKLAEPRTFHRAADHAVSIIPSPDLIVPLDADAECVLATFTDGADVPCLHYVLRGNKADKTPATVELMIQLPVAREIIQDLTDWLRHTQKEHQ